MTNDRERSFERITDEDLQRLAEIAGEDRGDLFRRKPQLGRLYRDRLLCVALCQGAALHYVDRATGVKDFDVWSFFAAHPDGPFPARRRVEGDFGPSKFGRMPMDTQPFAGRRVDLMGRSIDAVVGEDPVYAIRRYLASGRTASARALSHKPVVMIDPAEHRGTVVWPPPSEVRG